MISLRHTMPSWKPLYAVRVTDTLLSTAQVSIEAALESDNQTGIDLIGTLTMACQQTGNPRVPLVVCLMQTLRSCDQLQSISR